MKLEDIDRSFLIDRQGKTFVVYAGLLHEAHKAGLVSIQTEAVRVDQSFALFKAVVTMTNAKDGARTFEGHGDATPENVGRNIAIHFVRMAETRAKARALRDALDVGAAAIEELGDDEEPAPRQQPPRPAPRPQPQADLDDVQQPANYQRPAAAAPPAEDAFAGLDTRPAQRPSAPTPIRQQAPPQHQNQDAATPAQVRAIYLIARDNLNFTDAMTDARSVKDFGKPPTELSKREASQLITAIKAQAGVA